MAFTMTVSNVVRPQASLFRSTRPRRSSQIVRSNPLIGEVNNPENVKQSKIDKRRGTEWDEPKNSNKLEKDVGMRTGGDLATGDVKEAVGEAVEGVKDAVKHAAEKVTGKE